VEKVAGWLARSRERRSREFDAEAAMAAAAAMVCGGGAVVPAITGPSSSAVERGEY